ncbi:uncharacterized protein VTP21DRAFT_4217 [Calcarisporiella thermophila]|uniref:uncharacterized protein n=1 Tax=Calcarisporiella thermophila TaxID=911321 RepID=UPI0037426930
MDTSKADTPAFTFDVFKRIQPSEYIRRFLEQQVRPDGRPLNRFRKTALNTGTITTADGSAVARLGGTTVVCGIKAEVAEPKINKPNEGYLVPNLELSPICSSKFKPGPPMEQAQVMSELLDTVFKQCSVLRLSDLCIEEGKAVWVLYADLLCLNYDGNVIDAALIALVSALKNLRLPSASYNDGLVKATEDRPIQIQLQRIPLSSTFALFEGQYLLSDPNEAEESITEEMITVVVDERGQLCHVRKTGGLSTTPEILRQCIEAARSRYSEVEKILA